MAVRWPRYPLVYEINTRVWLRDLSARHRRTVTLATVPAEELAPIAALGFDAVWLMGVWTTGPDPVWVARNDAALRAEYTRALPDVTDEDIIGSPYAISRYEVADEIGGPGGLEVVRARHERSLGAQRNRQRVERMIDRPHRRALGDLSFLRCRRVLPLGKAVDLVVEQQDGQVHVAPQRVN